MHSRTEWPARISACRKAQARKQSRREKSRVSMAREGYRLWFCKCNDFNLHGVFSRDKRLQIQQCTAADRGHRRQAHTAAGHRIKHPLRDLQEPNSWVLIGAASAHSSPIPGESFVDRHSARVPRVPRVMDFSRFNIMLWVLRCRLVPRGAQPPGQRQSDLVSFGVGGKKEHGSSAVSRTTGQPAEVLREGSGIKVDGTADHGLPISTY